VDHGDINAIDGAANLSLSFWINWAATEDNASWMSKIVATSGPDGFELRESTTNAFRWIVWLSGTQGHALAGDVLTAGWHHIGCVFDGAGVGDAARAQLYLDGLNLSLTFPISAIPATIGANGASLLTGGAGREGVVADVSIGLVKLWTVSLTATEVLQEMNSYRPVRTAGLILWSPYDDGTNARDYSGAGNHGVVTGALQSPGPPVSYGGETMDRRELFQRALRVGKRFHLVR